MKAKTKRRERQIWLPGGEASCPHSSLETLVTYADEPLVDICRACQARVAEYGDCTGCKKHKRLIRFGVNLTRFCTGACESAWAEREEKRKKLATKQPASKRSGMHTD
jgi:hypothetical protein